MRFEIIIILTNLKEFGPRTLKLIPQGLEKKNHLFQVQTDHLLSH